MKILMTTLKKDSLPPIYVIVQWLHTRFLAIMSSNSPTCVEYSFFTLETVLSVSTDWERKGHIKACYFGELSQWMSIFFITLSVDAEDMVMCLCVWHVICLVSLSWLCIWICRLLTVNSAAPRGPRPTAGEPQGGTGFWLMTTGRAWGTSVALPRLSWSQPSHFLPEILYSSVFTENIFCVNFNKLVMIFHSGNTSHAQNRIGLWTGMCTSGGKSSSIQDFPGL